MALDALETGHGHVAPADNHLRDVERELGRLDTNGSSTSLIAERTPRPPDGQDDTEHTCSGL